MTQNLESEELVSVITPSYNQARYIEQCILSVKRQSYPHIEHIIMDGGSEDGTIDYLRRYESQYDMKWVSEPDNGQADAINKGFQSAQGSIVTWLNSDDVYFSRHSIAQVVEFFQHNNQAKFLFGDFAKIDAHNNVIKIRCLSRCDQTKLLERRCSIAQPAAFWRSEISQRYKLDPELDYVMDLDFWLRIGQDYQFWYLNEVLAGFRVHGSSKTVSAGDAKWQAERQTLMQRYGDGRGTKTSLLRAFELTVMSFPRRLRAAIYLLGLYRKNSEIFAFDCSLPPVSNALSQQVGKNRDH